MKMTPWLTGLILSAIVPSLASSDDYVKNVLPLMKKYCWECHSNEKKVKGNLALEPDVLPDQIGKFNIIRPGEPATSGFVDRLKLDESHTDFMPRKGRPLSAEDIATIEEWIRQGAIVDAGRLSDEEKERLEAMTAAKAEEESGLKFYSWKNREGKVIEARFLGLDSKGAKLALKDGKSYVVPLTALDDTSVALAQKLSKRP